VSIIALRNICSVFNITDTSFCHFWLSPSLYLITVHTNTRAVPWRNNTPASFSYRCIRNHRFHSTLHITCTYIDIVRCRVAVRATKMTGWLDLLALWLQSLWITFKYNSAADLHNLQLTVTHALGFFVSTSRLLATDLNTDTVTSNHYEVFLCSTNFPWLFPPENSELYCTVPTICWGPLTERLHSNGRGADLQKTCRVIPSQGCHWCADCCLATSNNHSFIDTQLLFLRVLTCLLSRYLAKLWPFTLRYTFIEVMTKWLTIL
jgi:hypothetical protein